MNIHSVFRYLLTGRCIVNAVAGRTHYDLRYHPMERRYAFYRNDLRAFVNSVSISVPLYELSRNGPYMVTQDATRRMLWLSAQPVPTLEMAEYSGLVGDGICQSHAFNLFFSRKNLC